MYFSFVDFFIWNNIVKSINVEVVCLYIIVGYMIILVLNVLLFSEYKYKNNSLCYIIK